MSFSTKYTHTRGFIRHSSQDYRLCITWYRIYITRYLIVIEHFYHYDRIKLTRSPKNIEHRSHAFDYSLQRFARHTPVYFGFYLTGARSSCKLEEEVSILSNKNNMMIFYNQLSIPNDMASYIFRALNDISRRNQGWI